MGSSGKYDCDKDIELKWERLRFDFLTHFVSTSMKAQGQLLSLRLQVTHPLKQEKLSCRVIMGTQRDNRQREWGKYNSANVQSLRSTDLFPRPFLGILCFLN